MSLAPIYYSLQIFIYVRTGQPSDIDFKLISVMFTQLSKFMDTSL